MSNKDDKLLLLLESKTFSELSKDERAFVLEQVSEREYELRREVLFTGKELVDEESGFLTPDPRIVSNLRVAMGGEEEPIPIMERIVAFIVRPVPAYQFTIAFAVLAILFVWNDNEVPAEIVYRDKIVYQEKHDTVYVDRPVIEIQTVEKMVRVVEYVPARNQREKKENAAYVSEKERMAEASASMSFALTDEQIERQKEKSFGNTGVDTQDLARLIGVLN